MDRQTGGRTNGRTNRQQRDKQTDEQTHNYAGIFALIDISIWCTDGRTHRYRHTDRHIDKRREESRKFFYCDEEKRSIGLSFRANAVVAAVYSSSAALLPINRQRMKAIVSDTILCFSCFAHSLGQGIATQEHIYLAPSHQINRSANVNPRRLRERL